MIEFLEQHLLPCTIKSWLGLDCPGCGMQRAFIALLRGQLWQSLQLNAGLIPFLATLLFTAAHLLFSFRHGARWVLILFCTAAAAMLFNFVFRLLQG